MNRAATPERTPGADHGAGVTSGSTPALPLCVAPPRMRVTREERCLILMRRWCWTNAMVADRCAPAAGRAVTHQMVSEVLRPRVRRSNMSGKVRAALIAEIERVVGDE